MIGGIRFRSVLGRAVDLAGRHPVVVLVVALLAMIATWSYASRLEVRSDVLELLPRDSPGVQAFEQRVRRAGGRATLVIVAESPDRDSNERFVDALSARLETLRVQRPDLVAYVESGTKDLRDFLERNRWLYASTAELEEADAKLDHEIAVRSGLVEDLDDDPSSPSGGQRALGLEKYRDEWRRTVAEKNQFPRGYFESADGTQVVVRVFATSTGMGAATDEELLKRVEAITRELHPEAFHPTMKVGLGGDIANAAAEKESLIREAIVATLVAAVLVLGGVVWFYRSFWSLVLVGLPPLFGVGCAYAFAAAKYGYVNASGAFLGAIILGNGVNYPIVLYSRYKEFRARGMDPEVARREAVLNAFRAELVGASVASIAYGSLTVTRFRGFTQFGVIGFVGMLLVWIAMIPTVPALIVLLERLQARLPRWMREPAARLATDESRGPVARFIGDLTERVPGIVLVVAVAVTAIAALRLPSFLRDPWEYDFDKLGSSSSRTAGPAQWSAASDRILSGRMNLAGSLVLCDRPEQAAALKARILEKDAADPQGSLIESINTVADFLPGPPEEQARKLEVLARMRERLSRAVLATLSPDELATVREMTPPESLRVLGPADLPDLLVQRFSERDGTIGTLLYVRYKPFVSTNDGHYLLRMAAALEGIRLDDGTRVAVASRATVFAEMIRSLERDGPLATSLSFALVVVVVLLATSSRRGAGAVLSSLVLGVTCMLGAAAWRGEHLNFLNFVALPITFGIGSEYPFNIYDRSRLLGGDVTRAVKLHFGAVTLCSYTTVIGYASLLFSDNQALQSFGRLATGGEIASLLAAVLFLPALLHVIARFNARDYRAPYFEPRSTPPTPR